MKKRWENWSDFSCTFICSKNTVFTFVFVGEILDEFMSKYKSRTISVVAFVRVKVAVMPYLMVISGEQQRDWLINKCSHTNTHHTNVYISMNLIFSLYSKRIYLFIMSLPYAYS